MYKSKYLAISCNLMSSELSARVKEILKPLQDLATISLLPELNEIEDNFYWWFNRWPIEAYLLELQETIAKVILQLQLQSGMRKDGALLSISRYLRNTTEYDIRMKLLINLETYAIRCRAREVKDKLAISIHYEKSKLEKKDKKSMQAMLRLVDFQSTARIRDTDKEMRLSFISNSTVAIPQFLDELSPIFNQSHYMVVMGEGSVDLAHLPDATILLVKGEIELKSFDERRYDAYLIVNRKKTR